jgi:hypothetical protein
MRNQTLFVLFIIAVCVSSCTAYKASRQQKKDDKLQVAILSNDRVLPKIIDYWNFAHPIDQKPIYIKGKDSVVYSTDSFYVDRVKDSLIKIECPYLNLDSLRKANVTYKIQLRYRIDSFIIPDTTCERRLTVVTNTNTYMKSQYDLRSVDYFAEKKRVSNRNYLVIGISIFWLLTVIAGVYFYAKKR